MGNICCAVKEIQYKVPSEKEDSKSQSNKNENGKTKKGYSISDFHQIKKLGEGSYGKVYLVKRKSDEMFFAIKRIKKESFVKD